MASANPFENAIVVQCATPDEFEVLRGAFQNPDIQRHARRNFFMVPRPGKRPEQAIYVIRGSLGKVFASATAEFAIQMWDPSFIIDFGTAGSISDKVRTGDLVLATKVVEYDVVSSRMKRKPEAACYKDFRTHMEAAIKGGDFSGAFFTGIIATGDRDVDTLEERKAIAGRTNAVAVTWESSAIGRVAEFHERCFASLRLITDTESIEDYFTADKALLESASRALRKALL